MNKKMMNSYAKLVIAKGINVQKGQEVVIRVSPNQVEFARCLVDAAYKAKAKKVTVEFTDEAIAKLQYKNESLQTLSHVSALDEGRQKYLTDDLPSMIHVYDQDPDYLKGIDTAKLSKAVQAKYPILKPYIDARENRYKWVIVAMPSVAWAKKVFPNASDSEAMQCLEDAIIHCTRLEGDPIENWEKHTKLLDAKAKKLNRFHFDKLVYTSKNGTNLTVGLNPKHIWYSAAEKSSDGNSYIANMPTEEIFTMPDKYRVDGVVYSSKPLSYQGNLIDDFSIRFKKGKVTKVKAKVGQKVLEEMVQMDEGAAYLGEVALVPFNSPINQTGLLFYNTLFDENACCHFALGRAFKYNLKGYKKMNDEDFEKANYNNSMIHVDFMIGSEDLKIVGMTSSDEEVVVFENGVWAI